MLTSETQGQKSNEIHFHTFSNVFTGRIGHQDQITSCLIICRKFDRGLYMTGPFLLRHMRFPPPIVDQKASCRANDILKFKENQ